MMGILTAIWNFWVIGILLPLGGSVTQTMALEVTGSMLILGIIVYLLMNFLVLARFEQIQAEQRKWPSIIIAIAFVFIMLTSGSIVLIASMLTFTSMIIGFVVMAIVFYYLYASGKTALGGAYSLSTSAGKSIQDSREASLANESEKLDTKRGEKALVC